MPHLHVIQALHGDCLLLEYGDPPHYLLIDGGPQTVYANDLRPKLAEIAANGGRLHGVILTHPDNDHVEGLVDFFTDLWMQKASMEPPLIAVEAVWMNSFRFDAEAPSLQAIFLPTLPPDLSDATAEPMLLEGVQEVLSLRTLVERLGIPVNPGFQGGLVAQDTKPATAPFAGVTLELLGPTTAQLKRLEKEWDKWFARREETGLPLSAAMPAPAAAVKPDSDASIPNRSSILLLATVAGKRILLTGDGRGKDVIAGMTRAGLMVKGGSCHVDVMKVPHHGSARNTSPDFFRRITADVYVLCADGKNDNPDYQALEWLVTALKEQGRRATLAATTLTPSLVQLQAHYPPAQWGYTLTVLDAGRHALTVSL